MNIIPACKLRKDCNREEIINCFCDNLMNKIKEAAKNGRNKICFDAHVYYHKPTGKVFPSIPKDSPRSEWEIGRYHFDDYADEVRRRFKNAGYVVKPTGFIGGVYQQSEDIMW